MTKKKANELLDLIKTKKVNITLLIWCDDHLEYNQQICDIKRDLTKNQYDKLKEWLCDI